MNRRDGVLCLSPEAGAYAELHEAALAVHPFDVEQTAQRAPPRAVDGRRRTARSGGATPRARRGAHAAHLARGARHPRALIAVARSPSTTARPAGPSTSTSASKIPGGASADRTPMRIVCATAPDSASRVEHVERDEVAGVVAREHRNRRTARRARPSPSPCRREPAGAAPPTSGPAAARRGRSAGRARRRTPAPPPRATARCASGS